MLLRLALTAPVLKPDSLLRLEKRWFTTLIHGSVTILIVFKLKRPDSKHGMKLTAWLIAIGRILALTSGMR
jgi:hypothetical protein